LSTPGRRLRTHFDTIAYIFACMKFHRCVQARKLASFVGQVISMSVLVGHVALIITRWISIDNLKAVHWDSYVSVSEECQADGILEIKIDWYKPSKPV